MNNWELIRQLHDERAAPPAAAAEVPAREALSATKTKKRSRASAETDMTPTTPPEPVSSPETLRAAIRDLPCQPTWFAVQTPGADHDVSFVKTYAEALELIDIKREYADDFPIEPTYSLASVRALLEAAAALVPQAPSAEPYSAERAGILLRECLKPEEINGTPEIRQDRMRELLAWMTRYADGKANGKWFHGHAFELAYFIATGGCTAGLDLHPVRMKAFIEGCNITAAERKSLERIGTIKPSPSAEPAPADGVREALQDLEREGWIRHIEQHAESIEPNPLGARIKAKMKHIRSLLATPPASAAEPAPGNDLIERATRHYGHRFTTTKNGIVTGEHHDFGRHPIVGELIKALAASQAIGVVPGAREKLEALFREALSRHLPATDNHAARKATVDSEVSEFVRRAVGGAA